MAGLHQIRSQLLTDGKITYDDVAAIENYIRQDGRLDLEDVKLLVDLLCEADEICPAFDDLFFPVLKEVVLEDGRIGRDEEFYLLKMIYSDGKIRDREKDFLMQLRREATDVSPEFEALCETALQAPATDWDVGGRRS